MNILEEIEKAILAEIPDAIVEVTGGGGHFSIVVTSKVLKGKECLNNIKSYCNPSKS